MSLTSNVANDSLRHDAGMIQKWICNQIFGWAEVITQREHLL